MTGSVKIDTQTVLVEAAFRALMMAVEVVEVVEGVGVEAIVMTVTPVDYQSRLTSACLSHLLLINDLLQ